jgi:hypothetical protein
MSLRLSPGTATGANSALSELRGAARFPARECLSGKVFAIIWNRVQAREPGAQIVSARIGKGNYAAAVHGGVLRAQPGIPGTAF